MMIHKEVQLIHNLAINMKDVTSKMKGRAVEIDGKLYQKQDFGKLPHNIMLEQASTMDYYHHKGRGLIREPLLTPEQFV